MRQTHSLDKTADRSQFTFARKGYLRNKWKDQSSKRECTAWYLWAWRKLMYHSSNLMDVNV